MNLPGYVRSRWNSAIRSLETHLGGAGGRRAQALNKYFGEVAPGRTRSTREVFRQVMPIFEIAPLFKADNATLSFYATKDGKISVSYQGWDQSKTVLEGQQFVIKWWPQGVDARIIDPHPRRFADPQDDSIFHPRTWHRLPAALALSGGFQIIRHALAELRAETELPPQTSRGVS